MWGFFAGMAAFAITLKPTGRMVDCGNGGCYLRSAKFRAVCTAEKERCRSTDLHRRLVHRSCQRNKAPGRRRIRRQEPSRRVTEALMNANSFVFRYRAVLISCTYSLGFSAYALDACKCRAGGGALAVGAEFAARSLAAHASAQVAGALLVAFAAFVRTWGAAYLRRECGPRCEIALGHIGGLTGLIATSAIRLYFASITLTDRHRHFWPAGSDSVIMVVGLTDPLRAPCGLGRGADAGMQQGEAYREYCRRVPRLWPSIKPRVPATGAKPHWGQAFWGEAFMWGSRACDRRIRRHA